MASLQRDQESAKAEQQKSLQELEDKYQKQIDSLQEHLQRVVTESQGKDDTIKQVGLLICMCTAVNGAEVFKPQKIAIANITFR